MERITTKLPERISAYIKEQYPGYSLISTKEDSDDKGRKHYIIDLVHQEKYFHLKINDLGMLIREAVEPQFANGYHEQYY